MHGAQQAVKHVTQNLQVGGAGGEELQLHGADLWEQEDATPRPVGHRRKLPQSGRLHLHTYTERKHTNQRRTPSEQAAASAGTPALCGVLLWWRQLVKVSYLQSERHRSPLMIYRRARCRRPAHAALRPTLINSSLAVSPCAPLRV